MFARFLASVLVSMVDPLLLLGCLAAGALVRKAALAIALGAGWAAFLVIGIDLVEGTEARSYGVRVSPDTLLVHRLAAQVVAAAIATAVIYAAMRAWRRRRRTE